VASSAALQRIGRGGTLASGGGNVLVFSSASGIGNGADTTEDTLFTASLPANTLDIVGRQILLEAWGALSATNAVKTIRMYFGALVYIAAQVSPSAVTSGDWSAQLLVTKTGNNAQIALGTSDFSGAAVVRNVQRFTSGAAVDTAPIVVKITGQSSVATAGSALCNQFTIGGYN
jgi:hypothetical protein